MSHPSIFRLPRRLQAPPGKGRTGPPAKSSKVQNEFAAAATV
jgi:hypothetical protein